MKIIVGLGNPGEQYKNTRHNAGFMLIDALAEKHHAQWQENKKFEAEICETSDGLLVKPQTFMNNSGQSVQAALSYYNLLPKKLGILKQKNSNLSDTLIILHDDLDINFGKYKKAIDRGAAGHNGVRSIINHLKTKNFVRLRIGIKGNKPNQMPTEKYVLQKFSKEEMVIIKKFVNKKGENNGNQRFKKSKCRFNSRKNTYSWKCFSK